MTNDEQDVPMLDLTQFASPEDAVQKIQRRNGFDDAMKVPLRRILAKAEGISMPIAVVMSATARARALYEAAVREIEHENPQAVFTLIRQFAETIAVVTYTADNPSYVNALIGNADRVGVNTCINHMNDAGYARNFGAVYGKLSDLAHYGPTAVWNPFSTSRDDDEHVGFSWRSAPHWKRQEDLYIACAYLLELGSTMEWALRKLARMVYDTTADWPIAGPLELHLGDET